MDSSETVTTVEWCAGYAGIGLGLKRVFGDRQRCLAYSDVEGFVQANLISKMEAGLLDAAPIWPNLKTFPSAEFHGLVDILVAGFPCQPFSHAGKREGDEDPRHLFPYIKRAAEVMRPRFLFLENVEGLISAKLAGEGWNDPAGTPVLLHVCRELERIGYTAAWGIFSASEVGAPHQRKRVFILAYDREQGLERETEGVKERGEYIGHIGDELRPGLESGGGEDVAHLVNEGLQGYSGDVNGAGREPGRAGGPASEGSLSGEQGNSGRELDNPMQRGRERFGQMGAGGKAADVAGEAVWPSRPGERQYAWEPPRVVGHDKRSLAISENLGREVAGKESGRTSEPSGGREAQPPMGGNADGPTSRMDFPGCTGLSDSELEEIYGWMVKGTNRTDELRMCGNGVVPQTAERAFRVLLTELQGLAGADDTILGQ